MYFSIFSVSIDKENVKDVLAIESIQRSRHKEAYPEDSDEAEDIGLSSEDEAEGLPDTKYVMRKYKGKRSTYRTRSSSQATASTMTSPEKGVPAPPPAPTTTPAPAPATASTSGIATVQVPVAALEQVKAAIDNIIAGLPSTSTTTTTTGTSQPSAASALPFPVPVVQEGDKKCLICKRSFWDTTALKKHIKTHTGAQKYTCPNAGCHRKLVSKVSYDNHMSTCGVKKTLNCPVAGCGKQFATQQALGAHRITHIKLPEAQAYCACGAGPFSTAKYKKDHYRTCSSNPDMKGPFPCLYPGCRRGPANPFTRIRNLNAHQKREHQHDPKHG